ncbi:MAG TPA: sulfite exporter TauE/SafE family protein [Gemmatales bacterium]|nr:sulfite exporter TauE/SafE family protein [Gemmatales bacterium]
MPAADLATTDPWSLLLAFAIALVAGAMNSIAGGGTILTYPVIFALVGDGKVANITSTLGLWPGSLGGAWGYRREMRPQLHRFTSFFVISLVGGGVGSLLLLWTTARAFERLVPFLILLATSAFMAQSFLAEWLARRRGEPATAPGPSRWLLVVALQWVVAVYGGYFGAGIGIMMLALLGFLGLTNLFEMNGLKNLGALCVNGVAIVQFVVADRFVARTVDWPIVGVMGVGAILGGYGSAGLARRIGPRAARMVIIVVGLGGAAWTAWKTWGSG